MDPVTTKKMIGWGIAILLTIMVGAIIKPFKIIGAGERGVVLRFGRVDRIMAEGFNWKTPLIEKVEKLDVKTQKEEVEANSASKDLQTVTTVIALNYHLDAERVGELWKGIGAEYKKRIIDPA